jgi:hypothetical protein
MFGFGVLRLELILISVGYYLFDHGTVTLQIRASVSTLGK